MSNYSFREYCEYKEELAQLGHLGGVNVNNDDEFDSLAKSRDWSRDDLQGLMDPDEPKSRPKVATFPQQPDKTYMNPKHMSNYLSFLKANKPPEALSMGGEKSDDHNLKDIDVDYDKLKYLGDPNDPDYEDMPPEDHADIIPPSPPQSDPFKAMTLPTKTMNYPELNPKEKQLDTSARALYIRKATNADVSDAEILYTLMDKYGVKSAGAAKGLLKKTRGIMSGE